MSAASFLPEWFWTEMFWFPEEITWDNFENYYNFSSVHELLYSIPLAFVYYVVQRGLYWFLFEPVAKLHGIETIQQFPPENPLLEKAFEISHKSNLNLVEIKRLSAEVNWTENQVKKWFRQRDIAEKGGVFKKFKESGWEFIFYCLMSIYGILCIWKKPWMWNVDLCWTDFYTTKITDDIWWYYMLQLSFYVYLMVSLFTDVKRKDFWQMMCHHIITLLLIGLSFVYSAFRFGSLILLCHEIAHVPLEKNQKLSKVLRYLKYETGAILAFIVFVLVWFPSRLGYFPFVLIPSYINYSHLYADNIYYLGCALQYALIVFHIIWSYMIIQIMIIIFNTKKVKDVRSDSEDSD